NLEPGGAQHAHMLMPLDGIQGIGIIPEGLPGGVKVIVFSAFDDDAPDVAVLVPADVDTPDAQSVFQCPVVQKMCARINRITVPPGRLVDIGSDESFQ